MKLEQLFPSAQTLDILDGEGNPTDLKFKVVGKDSKAYREATNKAMKVMMGKNAHQDPELVVKTNAELAASAVIGWEGLEGTPFSQAKAIELLSMPELGYILEQVEAFMADRANFFRKDVEAVGAVHSTGGEA